MKKIILLIIVVSGFQFVHAQTDVKRTLYNPNADAVKDIENAVAQAAREGKHVMLKVGGNWCGWCFRFNDFVKESRVIDSIQTAAYIVYHLNYSKENKNSGVMARYEFPQRFGFPVFLILDGRGRLIHTQNSALLEEGKSYSYEKVKEFYLHWTPQALDPGQYKE